ncbi:anti-sigma factor family protein [Azospirillum palustre]
MTGENDESAMPSDEELTAFIDGELEEERRACLLDLIERDPAVAARVEHLSRASLPYGEAFQPLLDAAPAADLQRMLDGTTAPPVAAGAVVPLTRRRLFGAIAASVMAGVLGDRLLVRLFGTGDGDELADDDGGPDREHHWHGVVAQYMGLYTRETLGGGTPGHDAQSAQLAALNRPLNLSLTPEAVEVAGAEFRRAQILSYDDMPLAQITYLDPRSGPLALCILRRPGTVRGVEQEMRGGLSIAYWNGPDHAALLIGRLPPQDLTAKAEAVRGRLAI